MKGKIFARLSAYVLATCFGLLMWSYMRKGENSKAACIHASKSIIETCFNRIAENGE